MNTRLKEFSTWKRVEFRCMIQDILNNEIYTKQDSGTFGDRTIFYCITIPGENEWVRQTANNGFDEFHKETYVISEDNKDEKLSLSLVNFSYPITSGENRSCLIKVYDLNLVEFLRVNDIVQVSGFLEPNEIAIESTTTTTTDPPGMPSLGEKLDFEPANDFPHRLVPRIHVDTLKKLKHINPTLPDVIERVSLDLTRLRLARVRLTTMISQLFGGDELAADYFVLSLLAKIQKRKDIMTIGPIPINITGIKPEMKHLIEKLYNIVTKITTHSHFLDLSIANLNNLQFTPQKDHDNNKMIAGMLQLPDGLFLMINETALSEGLLTERGLANLDTLKHIIRWQTHQYNFQFHSVEIDTDLNILVLSEGKSVLGIPITLKLKYDDLDSIKQASESIDDFLTEELLNTFRYYISTLRQGDALNYQIPDELETIITKDYARLRKAASEHEGVAVTPDDLSTHMTLARLLTISRGEQMLTREIWEETCRMEATRNARLV